VCDNRGQVWQRLNPPATPKSHKPYARSRFRLLNARLPA